MRIFKSYFILFILLFLCCDDVCCFNFPGRRRKNSSSSSSSSSGSFLSSSSGYVESDVELNSDRIFLVFKEGLLETQARCDFFTQIGENCQDDNFRQQCLDFVTNEVEMIHSLFMQSAKINNGYLRLCSEKEVSDFNKSVYSLNEKFENYLIEKENRYLDLCKFINCVMTESLFRQSIYNSFLLQFKLLLAENEVMKLYIEQSLGRLEAYVDLNSMRE